MNKKHTKTVGKYTYYMRKVTMPDGKRKEIPASEIRSIILKNQSTWMAWGLTTLESGKYAPTWVHGDCRPTGRKTILIVGDKK